MQKVLPILQAVGVTVIACGFLVVSTGAATIAASAPPIPTSRRQLEDA